MTTEPEQPFADTVLRGWQLNANPHELQRPRASRERVASVAVQPVPNPRLLPGYAHGFEEGVQSGHAQALTELTEAMRATAEAQAEQSRLGAAQAGHAEGLQRAREEAQASLAAALAAARQEHDCAMERIAAVIAAIQHEHSELKRAAEDDLVALVHAGVCRILAVEAAKPDAVRALVRDLVKEQAGKDVVAIHVHPQDHALIGTGISTPEQSWQCVADESVQMGGAILRSMHGSLDARIETQVAALGAALMSARASANRPGET